jgi:acyl-coenzyme A synthetase/AMP-(fatty) acid ligase
MSKPKLILLKIKDLLTGDLKKIYKTIDTKTPAIIIFTTGTTGAPKPALLSHENIIIQNEILCKGAQMDKNNRTLVNLPPSHVGCITETLLTTFYMGATAVLLKIFNVKFSLEAIEKHKVTLLGQIPTQFRMMWAESDYKKYDLSSLKFAAMEAQRLMLNF